jgi:peptide/nickel transport system substrate-binding protein
MRFLALIGVIVASGCAAASSAAGSHANPWTTPHVLTISDASDPDSLNPHIGSSAPTANLSEMTMAWLVRWNEQNQPVPELATEIPSRANGGVSADGRTITYHLRKGVVWSDGAPFTADDVVFSANTVNNPANHETGRFDQLASAVAIGKYTVAFHLKKPYSAFVEGFFSSCCANPSLLPKHILGKYPNINNVPYNSLPVGIGPFKFERWDREKQVVLVANPLYWRGRPKLDKIVYRIIPTQAALMGELAAHRVDLWYQFGGAFLPRIKAVRGLEVIRQPSYAFDHLDFNINRPVLSELAVRQALRYATDRRALIDKAANGIGHLQDSATPLVAPYFVDLGATPYDPDKANAVLDRAGWVRGGDGIRQKNGVRLDIDVALVSSKSGKLFDMLAQQWRRVGATISVTRYPSAKYFASPAEGGVVYGNNWDAVFFAWGADPYGDYSGYYGCGSFPPNGGNNLRWCNKTADASMHALYAHYTQPERTADVRVVMEQLIADVPTIVMQMREDMFAFNSDLKGYHPNSVTPFDNMLDVDI